MAITKLERLKASSGGHQAQHLQNSIQYICNPEKTGGGLYIGGNAGLTPDISYNNMLRNKAIWGKEDGTQGFHYILSFSPDVKVDENTVLKIADEFCEELFQKKYYYVTAVHNDKDHMHVHIVFDSVSREDGKKFHSPQNDWNRRIQPITDKLCQKYHLPTLEYSEERKGKNYAQWRSDQNGNSDSGRKTKGFTWYDVIRDDIDEAIANTSSYPEFLQYLKDRYYTIREGNNHKYLSVKPYGRERPVRTSRLGEAYSKEMIMLRIQDKSKNMDYSQMAVHYGDMQKMKKLLFIKIEKNRNWKFTPFQRTFYRRWHNTYFIRRPPYKTLWKYRSEIMEVTKLSDCIGYLLDHDIESQTALVEKQRSLQGDMDTIDRRIGLLKSRLYHTQSYFYVRKYQKLEKEFDKTGDPDIRKEMVSTKKLIEEKEPYEQVIQKMAALQQEMKECRIAKKEIRQELKTTEEVMNQFYRIQATAEVDLLQRIPMDRDKRKKTEREVNVSGRRKESEGIKPESPGWIV